MRLTELYDSLGETTDQRMTSGSSFYVSPRDRRTRARIEKLRTKGHKIVSLGACRFRCESDPVSNQLKTDGTPFYNNHTTAAERYRLGKLGYQFRRVRKGIFICTKVL